MPKDFLAVVISYNGFTKVDDDAVCALLRQRNLPD